MKHTQYAIPTLVIHMCISLWTNGPIPTKLDYLLFIISENAAQDFFLKVTTNFNHQSIVMLRTHTVTNSQNWIKWPAPQSTNPSCYFYFISAYLYDQWLISAHNSSVFGQVSWCRCLYSPMLEAVLVHCRYSPCSKGPKQWDKVFQGWRWEDLNPDWIITWGYHLVSDEYVWLLEMTDLCVM